MKKLIITTIIIALAVVLGIKGKALLNSKQKEIANEKTPAPKAISVETISPKHGVLVNKEPFIAKVLFDKTIKLSTKLAGYIQKIYVTETQKVKKGELLVQIDDTELRSSIDALNSTLLSQKKDLELAKSIYRRNLELYKVGGLPKEKLDISKVSLNLKESMIENTKQKIFQIKHQLSYLKIIAPFDGYIDSVILHEGDLAAAGRPILSMSNGVKKLVFSYAPSKKDMIKKSQEVLSNGEKIGVVDYIYTTTQNGLITAEVKLTKDVDLPSGSSLDIEVLTKKLEGCMIDDGTLLHKKEGTYIMVYKNGTFSPLKIDILMQEGNNLIINPCPDGKIAKASETKLSKLPAYDRVNIIGDK